MNTPLRIKIQEIEGQYIERADRKNWSVEEVTDRIIAAVAEEVDKMEAKVPPFPRGKYDSTDERVRMYWAAIGRNDVLVDMLAWLQEGK